MNIDTEVIRNAAGTLDVLTSNLATDNPLRMEAAEGAKRAVADLYRIADTIDAQAAEIKRLKEALKLAYDAMNYMGDVLNGMDAVEPEDEAATTSAFEAVRAALQEKSNG